MDNSPFSKELPNPHKTSLVLSFCLISCIFIYLVFSRNFIFGSKAGKWVYPFFSDIAPIPVWIPIVVFLLLGVLVIWGSKHIYRHEIATLIIGVLIAITIQILINSIYHFPLSEIVRSDTANSFYTPAQKYSPVEILSSYQTLAPSLPLHARTNLPGKILFFQFLGIFTSSPRLMAYLIISISTLGGCLLYEICRILFNNKMIAYNAFILYVLIPCKQYFFPILNTVTPVFILLSMLLLLLFINSKKKLFLVLLGVSLYLLVLFEPSPLTTGIIFVGILLNAIGNKRISSKDLSSVFLLSILSFAAMYFIFRFIFSFDLLRAFDYVLKDAVQFNVQAKREYWIWIGGNIKEFFWGAGLPVMMIFIYFATSVITQWLDDKTNILHLSSDSLYVICLLLTFIIVLFWGINRGEITRLWIYLAVFFQIPAAIFLDKIIKSPSLFFILAAIMVCQSMIGLQKVTFVAP